MRLAIDAMGGDHAPEEVVKGSLEAAEVLPEDEIVLVGPREKLSQMIESLGGPKGRLQIAQASAVIEMSASPVEAIRKNPDSSLRVAIEMMAGGQADAVVSAGNTGAFVAAAMMYARRLEGVRRPAISVVFPTRYGPVVVIDVGANIKCTPIHLLQFGVMAATYAELMFGVKTPRVGLLNIGTEDAKGSVTVRQTHELMDRSPLNFVGNVEGRDLFNNVCDVVVCDGFVGNIMLKVVEGMAGALLEIVRDEVLEADKTLAEKLGPVLQKVARGHDYSEVGGAPLLGIDGICIICHGASRARAIRNALRVASRYARENINQQIVNSIARLGADAK